MSTVEKNVILHMWLSGYRIGIYLLKSAVNSRSNLISTTKSPTKLKTLYHPGMVLAVAKSEVYCLLIRIVMTGNC